MIKYLFIATFAGLVSLVYKYLSHEIAIAVLSGVVGGLAWDFTERSTRSK